MPPATAMRRAPVRYLLTVSALVRPMVKLRMYVQVYGPEVRCRKSGGRPRKARKGPPAAAIANGSSNAMSATPACAKEHSTPQKSEEVVVNEDHTLKYVFVWVKSGVPERAWPAPKTPAVLDQVGCMVARNHP